MKTRAVKGKPGVRVKENGKFIATKSINGKRTTKEFDSPVAAYKWKEDRASVDLSVNGKDPARSGSGDGKDEIFFRDVYAQYFNEGMVSLRKHTKKRKIRRMNKFFSNLLSVRMSEMNGRTILQHVIGMTATVDTVKSRRCNFDKELKDLSSVFNWYDEEITPFTNPIRSKHYDAGTIRSVPKLKRDLPSSEIPRVMEKMRPMYRRALVMQFLMAARIGEVCGMNNDTVDFRSRTIRLSETIIWDDSNPVHQRDNKTGEATTKEMTPLMEKILLDLKQERPRGCKFFFQRKGHPLRYNEILKDLTRALKEAGLEEYRGTHIFRYSMGEYARGKEGREVAQAIMSHADPRMTEHYAKLKADKRVTSVVIQAEEIFRGTTVVQPSCNQEVIS